MYGSKGQKAFTVTPFGSPARGSGKTGRPHQSGWTHVPRSSSFAPSSRWSDWSDCPVFTRRTGAALIMNKLNGYSGVPRLSHCTKGQTWNVSLCIMCTGYVCWCRVSLAILFPPFCPSFPGLPYLPFPPVPRTVPVTPGLPVKRLWRRALPKSEARRIKASRV